MSRALSQRATLQLPSESANYTPITPALQDVVGRIAEGINDVSILLIGDSTGTMTSPNSGWGRLLPAKLASLFPTHTISTRAWNASTDVYDAATTTPGTGPRTINVWNGCASSKIWDYQATTLRLENLIAAANPDAMIVAHGHNEYGSSYADNIFYKLRDRAVAMIETYRTFAPQASVLVMSQNPLLASPGLSEKRADIYRRMCNERGYGFIDITKAFNSDGRSLSVLVNTADNIHPTAAGYALWVNELGKAFRNTGQAPMLRPTNPAFYDYGSSIVAPKLAAAWTASNATLTDDTTLFESGTSSVQIVKSVTGSAGEAYFALPAKIVAGKTITVAVRMYIPLALKNVAGRIKITDGITSPGLLADVPWDNLTDQWVWRILTARVAPGATVVRVYVAGDTSFNDPLTPGIRVDRVVTTLGRYPVESF